MAILSEDGTMYLDLDRMDGVSSNGTHSDYANIESPVSLTEVKDSPGPCLDQAKTEQDVSVVKKKIKPPMPPIKEARPSEPEKTDPLLNKVCNMFLHLSHLSSLFCRGWTLLALAGQLLNSFLSSTLT